jgi:hypothetical protein
VAAVRHGGRKRKTAVTPLGMTGFGGDREDCCRLSGKASGPRARNARKTRATAKQATSAARTCFAAEAQRNRKCLRPKLDRVVLGPSAKGCERRTGKSACATGAVRAIFLCVGYRNLFGLDTSADDFRIARTSNDIAERRLHCQDGAEASFALGDALEGLRRFCQRVRLDHCFHFALRYEV